MVCGLYILYSPFLLNLRYATTATTAAVAVAAALVRMYRAAATPHCILKASIDEYTLLSLDSCK